MLFVNQGARTEFLEQDGIDDDWVDQGRVVRQKKHAASAFGEAFLVAVDADAVAERKEESDEQVQEIEENLHGVLWC